MWEGRREARPAAAFLAALLLVAVFASAAFAAPGDLDNSFDGDGKRTVDLGSSYESATAVALQPDGKIVFTSYIDDPPYVVTRLNPDGSLDTGFGGGSVSIGFTGYDDESAFPSALFVQPDGKVVVWGSVSDFVYTQDVGMARLNPNGSLDPGFGVVPTGKRVFGANDSYESAGPMVLKPNGQFFAGWGWGAAYGGNRSAFVGQFDSQGYADSGFGLFGVTGADFPGVNEAPRAIALIPDGRFVVAYTLSNTSGQSLGTGVGRYQPNGLGDSSFDSDGLKTFGSGGAAGVAALPDGKVLVGGSAGTSNFVVTRLNPDGSPDPSFGNQGSRTIDFEGTTEEASEMVVLANGKILIAGSSNSGEDFAIARLQPGGELDTTFNFDGKQKVNFFGNDSLGGMALQPDGNIVLAGRTSFTNDVAVARLEGDPASAGGGPAGPGAGGSGGTGGGPGGVAPRCAGKRATIVGTNRSERLKGTKKSDVIVALGGNDRISGLRGNDRICAGKGKDRVSGGPGSDTIEGGPGNDTIKGDTGDDSLKGQGDKDKLTGGAGRDRMSGGGGRDNCSGGGGKDRATCEKERGV